MASWLQRWPTSGHAAAPEDLLQVFSTFGALWATVRTATVEDSSGIEDSCVIEDSSGIEDSSVIEDSSWIEERDRR